MALQWRGLLILLCLRGACPACGDYKGTNTYLEGSIEVWEDHTEIANDDFPVKLSGREIAIVLGDGNRPNAYIVPDDMRASPSQCRCVQERDLRGWQ